MPRRQVGWNERGRQTYVRVEFKEREGEGLTLILLTYSKCPTR